MIALFGWGGAVDVKGNVAMHDHNGTAEWNAYWHPKATHQLVHSGLDVMLVPLDATNSLPVSWEFLNALAEKPNRGVRFGRAVLGSHGYGNSIL
ncbi:hypothetical protein KUL42_25940 [Alteromonas sp. KUL42]|uniref:nucleoside hydrolase n=1 Tax=Alteromonas sp. KUL42 TaxID=2480797 RepID=UPI001035E2D1|nr:nucleoside hydrolase [Alteromonas sp. KUL42]TAP34426.1 hypothetical protein EYR97_12805 [Alteromonas sp. KUL42]GEA07833.1 hypothetical protein KUL42_25940 [Alteromonas sp. KUL42]